GQGGGGRGNHVLFLPRAGRVIPGKQGRGCPFRKQRSLSPLPSTQRRHLSRAQLLSLLPRGLPPPPPRSSSPFLYLSCLLLQRRIDHPLRPACCLLRPGVPQPSSPPTPGPLGPCPAVAGRSLTNMITPQALRTMPQAASLGPQHRSDAMKKGVGDRLAAGGAGRRREEGPDAPGESELDSGARAAEDGPRGTPPRGRGLRPQPSRRGGPPGIAGRLRALPDLRRGQALCETEAAPQKSLRTLVAGARCCSSNASRFWSPLSGWNGRTRRAT
ncbi:unnamed protein product, partial [Gulo gulo]